MRTRKQEKARLLKMMERLESDDSPILDDDEREKLREEIRSGLWRIFSAEKVKGKSK
jgi:hypothetical protein